MTLYAIPTTTQVVKVCGTGKRLRGEFAAVEELQAMGIRADACTIIEMVRLPKQRFPDPVSKPRLRGYIFADVPNHLFHDAATRKPILGPLMAVPRTEVAQVEKFIDACLDQRAEAMAQYEAGEAVTEFKSGDPIRHLGAFADSLLKFQGVVYSSRDAYPKIKATMDMMGQEVTVELNPIDVRKVG